MSLLCSTSDPTPFPALITHESPLDWLQLPTSQFLQETRKWAELYQPTRKCLQLLCCIEQANLGRS